MNYSQDEFFELADQVEQQGGEHTDAICDMRTFESFSGKKKPQRPFILPGCGESALFEIPYPPMPKYGDSSPYPGILRLCAVDDALGAWPRFGGDALADTPQRELFFLHGDTLEKNDPRVVGK